MSELENITILFHDTYEEVSKKYGYQTRKDTKVFDMESPNGKTMYETVEKIMTPYLQEIERYKNIIDELDKYFEEKIKECDLKGCSFEQTYITGKWNAYKKSLNKLKELKGE